MNPISSLLKSIKQYRCNHEYDKTIEKIGLLHKIAVWTCKKCGKDYKFIIDCKCPRR